MKRSTKAELDRFIDTRRTHERPSRPMRETLSLRATRELFDRCRALAKERDQFLNATIIGLLEMALSSLEPTPQERRLRAKVAKRDESA